MKSSIGCKLSMLIFQLLILIAHLKCNPENDHRNESPKTTHNWRCNNKMDTAFVYFKLATNLTLNTGDYVTILYQYKICQQCDLIELAKIPASDQDQGPIANVTINSFYAYYFKAITGSGEQLCDTFLFDKFGECGVYEFEIDSGRCSISQMNEPNKSDYWLILGLGILIIFILITNLIQRYQHQLLAVYDRISGKKADSKQAEIEMNIAAPEKKPAAVVKKRLQALDTFRGVSLFLMIFVNYGSGGYEYLKHVPWHGITLADFVFPWFLWIMGFSIPLAINSLLNKPNPNRLLIFRRILWRSVKMFAIGLILNSRYGVELANWRIFGVLQRIAVCYFIVATLEVILYHKVDLDKSNMPRFIYYIYDLYWSKIHILVMTLILLVWFLLTYLVQIDGCPRGYMGPGGLHDHGRHYNCTGGVAGLVDRVILGRSHVYGRPTPFVIYKTVEPFDPEGFFGVFNSVILTYLGVQAGRVYLFYKANVRLMVTKWTIWGLLCAVLFAALTQFDLQNGAVPVNKNLWTFTYTLITAVSSYFLFVFLYVIIDVNTFWCGNPFIYLGMNSIIIYFCHAMFNRTIPSQWIVAPTHLSQMLMHLWGCIFWTLVSIYLYLNKIFVNL